jgi:hypothetical protein
VDQFDSRYSKENLWKGVEIVLKNHGKQKKISTVTFDLSNLKEPRERKENY